MSSSQIPSNPTSNTIAALLPKLHDNDPDYRFMSLNDLYAVLNIGRPDFLYNDYNTAARTVDGVLKTLDDQNGEVQNLAIKWWENCSPRSVKVVLIKPKSRPTRYEAPQQHPESPY
jgi:cullin-associated NEDD8-dissociated protein 1